MRLAFAWLTLAALLFCGCSSLQPISSTPPAKAIVLAQPVKVDMFLKHALYPAGEYHPLYEDKQGYYFQAPSKVIGKDLVGLGYMLDGGLYVKRGSREPSEWYYIDPQNASTIKGRFKTVPEFKLLE